MKYHKTVIFFLSIFATFIFYWHLPELLDLLFELQDYPRGSESIGIDYHSVRVRFIITMTKALSGFVLLALALGLWMSVSCQSAAQIGRDTSRLEKQLLELGYTDLFLRLNDEHLSAIWKQDDAPEQLARLVFDESASHEARFLAAEILFRKQESFPAQDGVERLAKVYGIALQNAQIGNLWGLPGYLDGLAGEHYVSLGEPAIPTLIPLLRDEREVFYEGSREATYANAYRYRVKDFAAFYISQILDIPYEIHLKPTERDVEIERLRSYISKYKEFFGGWLVGWWVGWLVGSIVGGLDGSLVGWSVVGLYLLNNPG